MYGKAELENGLMLYWNLEAGDLSISTNGISLYFSGTGITHSNQIIRLIEREYGTVKRYQSENGEWVTM